VRQRRIAAALARHALELELAQPVAPRRIELASLDRRVDRAARLTVVALTIDDLPTPDEPIRPSAWPGPTYVGGFARPVQLQVAPSE
jgi:hypothetical protein